MHNTSRTILLLSFLSSLCLHGEVIIRPATLDDLDAISHLINQTYNETFKPLYSNLLKMMSFDQTVDNFINEKITKQNSTAAEFITKQLNKEECVCLVAYNKTSETNQQLVGYCRFSKNKPNNVHIYLLTIDKNFQRNGIGTQLLFNAINTFENVDTCTLRVLVGNDLAHSFYKKNGFQNTGTVSLDQQTGKISTNPDSPITHVDYMIFLEK
jgi:ribosomal protein S18 acetylase RimI-like enzyme